MTLFGIELSDSGRGMWTATDEETGTTVNVSGPRGARYATADGADFTVIGPSCPTPEAAVAALEALVRTLAARCGK